MKKAPFYNDVAQAPDGGQSLWIYASDGVRLRVAVWNTGTKGTVLLFPGRTEFVEKYGRTVSALQVMGYACAVIDWRGQGLSDRLASNRALGHVVKFSDYQMDADAFAQTVDDLDLPKPWFLCSHSMGGAIALRSLHRGLDVKRSIFFSPMWAFSIDPMLRPMVQAVASGTSSVGLGEEFAPGTGPDVFLATAPFENNQLTSSRESWGYISSLVQAHPGLGIGGPSINWLAESIAETRALERLTPPDSDVMCIIGSAEKVVNKQGVISYMDRWPNSMTLTMAGGEHETLMETAQIRARALAALDLYFS